MLPLEYDLPSVDLNEAKMFLSENMTVTTFLFRP